MTGPIGPYPGLRPFTDEESWLFFGRDEQVNKIVERLRDKQFSAVIGGSGCGKSSLVWAGVIPELRCQAISDRSDIWLPVRATPGDKAISRLAHEFAKIIKTVHGSDEERRIEELLLYQKRGLSRFVDNYGRRIVNEDTGVVFPGPIADKVNLLIFLDQFEEIFRDDTDRPQAERLIKLLVEEYEEKHERLFVILTMRSEFLDRCARDIDLPDVLNETAYLARRLMRRELEEVIIGPPQPFWLETQAEPPSSEAEEDPLWPYEVTVTEKLLQAVDAIREDSDHLPLLQHALFWIWKVAYDDWAKAPATVREPFVITDAHLREALRPNGGATAAGESAVTSNSLLGGCLNALADEIYEKRLSGRQKEIAEVLCKLMVQVDETGLAKRRFTTRDAVKTFGDFSIDDINSTIRAFTEPHPYLRQDGDEHDDEISVSHEALIRNWRRYTAWFQQDRKLADAYHDLLRSYKKHKQDRKSETHFNMRAYPELDDFEKLPDGWLRRYTKEFLDSPRYSDERVFFFERNNANQESLMQEIRDYVSYSRNVIEWEETRARRERMRAWVLRAGIPALVLCVSGWLYSLGQISLRNEQKEAFDLADRLRRQALSAESLAKIEEFDHQLSVPPDMWQSIQHTMRGFLLRQEYLELVKYREDAYDAAFQAVAYAGSIAQPVLGTGFSPIGTYSLYKDPKRLPTPEELAPERRCFEQLRGQLLAEESPGGDRYRYDYELKQIVRGVGSGLPVTPLIVSFVRRIADTARPEEQSARVSTTNAWQFGFAVDNGGKCQWAQANGKLLVDPFSSDALHFEPTLRLMIAEDNRGIMPSRLRWFRVEVDAWEMDPQQVKVDQQYISGSPSSESIKFDKDGKTFQYADTFFMIPSWGYITVVSEAELSHDKEILDKSGIRDMIKTRHLCVRLRPVNKGTNTYQIEISPWVLHSKWEDCASTNRKFFRYLPQFRCAEIKSVALENDLLYFKDEHDTVHKVPVTFAAMHEEFKSMALVP